MKNILHNRLFLLVISSIMIIGILAGCQTKDNNAEENEPAETEANNNEPEDTEEEVETELEAEEPELEDYVIDYEETDAVPEVTIEMEDGGTILVELYPNVAPNAVNNFISLAEGGFYDGVIFHRVIPGFMIQGGDPDGTGTGGPGYNIPGEFSSNGIKNELIHERGVLSMARSGHPDSAGSQFFIMHENSPHLDGDYAGFGKAVEGLDVVDEIVSVETIGGSDQSIQDTPVEDQVIKKMTVDLKGYEAEEPVKTAE